MDDIALLGLKPDMYSYTSDHFETLQSLCERMIRERKAFADDTDPDTMKKEREERTDSKNRNNCESLPTALISLHSQFTVYYLLCIIFCQLTYRLFPQVSRKILGIFCHKIKSGVMCESENLPSVVAICGIHKMTSKSMQR